MSFGYSIGDVFAIAGVIERIVNEVRAYQSAPLHFQRLAVELGFLSTVCKQVFELRPSLPDELHHIGRIRAIAIQCLGPLQEFEARMATYENTLGTHGNQCGATGSGSKGATREKIKHLGRRLHWSVIERHDVDGLRAILTSEILAINTLLTMMEWRSLQSQKSVSQEYLTQLRTLIRTTNDAATEIKQFLIDCKLASENLQDLIISGNVTQAQQIQILTAIESKTGETRKAVNDLSQWHQQYTAGVKSAVDNVSTQIVRLFSFTAYMEDWIRKIVQYCKDIIAMVDRNTQILLTLHSMMTRLSVLLNRSGVSLPILEFENPFGHTLALPYQLCDTWDGLNRLLLCMFFNKPGLKLVELGRFLITNTNTNRIIKPTLWSASIAPGDRVFMSMVLERIGHKGKLCPRCHRPLPNLSSASAICNHCQLWSSRVDYNNVTLGISESSNKSGIPVPPPEAPLLWSSRWNGTWRPNDMTEQDIRSYSISKRKRRGIYPGEDTPLSDLADDEIEESFRRVHVIPFQGDPLEALIKIGQRCRDLVVEFSSGHLGLYDTLSASPFKDTFSSILSDLEEIRAMGISPMLELCTRQGLVDKHAILDANFMRTSMMLRNAPLGPEFSWINVLGLAKWLTNSEGTTNLNKQQDGYICYDSTNHPLRGTKYWPRSPSSQPKNYPWSSIHPGFVHNLKFHKHPMPRQEEVKLMFMTNQRVGHGHTRLVYGEEA
ncbi:hypothetical protein O1611_g2461 [Lasiodiplodia mahajangana]|uniref:Uncharacterized protein n=1 Tax=Lasiodiplodia mahajangana TaxID=1108764 RepID=A0ACC2JUG1_9PEZI|nr:hypothetical protein O1611_g2461 [Lasiodiplodia mahajangana]